MVGMLKRNEYKRRQALPVGIRVTQRGFGQGLALSDNIPLPGRILKEEQAG